MAARVEIPLITFDATTQRVVAEASITIKNRGSGAIVPVYDSSEDDAAVIGQPLTSDAVGRVQGWLPRGSYVATINPPSGATYDENFDLMPAGDGEFDAGWVPDGAIPTSKLSGTLIQPRQTSAFSTSAPLAANASETGIIVLGQGIRVMRIATDFPARVRLYETAAQRDADAARAAGVVPVGDHGLVLDVVTPADGGAMALRLAPNAFGENYDVPPTSNFYYNVTNLDAVARTIQTTLDWQLIE